MLMPDRGIIEMIWPSNDATAGVFVPQERIRRFGPITEKQVQPTSLDVRLSEEVILQTGSSYILPEVGYHMAPGETMLATLVERFELRANNVAARIEGKSSWARKFLTVHSAGFIDPGFKGDITLELKNDSARTIMLRPGAKIAQVCFLFLAGEVLRMYGDPALGSHYQDQDGPTPSWIQS